MKRLLIIGILSLFFVNIYAVSYTVETVPNDHLKDARDYVSNPDHIISHDAEQKINEMLASAESYSTAQVAVVLLGSIGSDDIDDFGTRLFNSWGIGKDKKDNGLLFLLVYDQQQMIFRTGYGLEGVLPDVILSRIIRNDISPDLKQGDFDAGIVAGISKVCEYLKNPDTVQEIIQQDNAKLVSDYKALFYKYLIICLIVFLSFFLISVFELSGNQTRYNKYLSMNKWKGFVIFFTIIFFPTMVFYAIFYFFMLRRLRNKPIACPNCGHKMRKLNEIEEDTYLNPAQQKEETIHSVDYDVWFCDNCSQKEILPYTKQSRYTNCPYCHARTYLLSGDHIIKRATSLSSGQGEKEYVCKNCGKKDFKRYIIPMIVVASASSGRGGGFGGGGFSGGGGSWGGGSTGGGGARGGW